MLHLRLRFGAPPNQLVAPDEVASLFARPALAEDEVEVAGVEPVDQNIAQLDGEFEVDERMILREFGEDLRQP